MNRFYQGTLEDWKNKPEGTREAIARLWLKASKPSSLDIAVDAASTLVRPVTMLVNSCRQLVNSYMANSSDLPQISHTITYDSPPGTKNIKDKIEKIILPYSELNILHKKYL